MCICVGAMGVGVLSVQVEAIPKPLDKKVKYRKKEDGRGKTIPLKTEYSTQNSKTHVEKLMLRWSAKNINTWKGNSLFHFEISMFRCSKI